LTEINPQKNVTGTQFRAARCLLDWTITDVLKASGLSATTLNRIERETKRAPSLHAYNLLRLTYEKHGIEFLFDGGTGVKLKEP